VSSSDDGQGNALVTISDTGPGLDPAQRDQIFDAFFTTKPKGIGMGLPTCRSIIETHGGRMWAESNTPSGATFRFTVPSAGRDRA
jgi:signal transduction histidine kinase